MEVGFSCTEKHQRPTSVKPGRQRNPVRPSRRDPDRKKKKSDRKQDSKGSNKHLVCTCNAKQGEVRLNKLLGFRVRCNASNNIVYNAQLL